MDAIIDRPSSSAKRARAQRETSRHRMNRRSGIKIPTKPSMFLKMGQKESLKTGDPVMKSRYGMAAERPPDQWSV